MNTVISSLDPLDPKHLNELYERANYHETIFRTILMTLSETKEEVNFFKASSLDDIFDKYIRIDGEETRVSDFRVGAFDNMILPPYMFPDLKHKELDSDKALMIIQRPNDSWIKLYQVLENSGVRLLDSMCYEL